MWRPELAYAVGLLASDGCLGQDGLWVDLTSKDKEQLLNFSKCLGRTFTIGNKYNKAGSIGYRIQFKNKLFYEFLLSVGLTPRKSLTLGPLAIPKEYFWDFLRGSFDGDGCFYSYWDPRWRSSHMFYIVFASASKKHIAWLQSEIYARIGCIGHMTTNATRDFFQLKYAKMEALAIIKEMYYTPSVICLSRKSIKIQKALKVEREQQDAHNSNSARVA